jgi:hypothetical protein
VIRPLLTLASAIFLLLCLATLAVWVRSGWRQDVAWITCGRMFLLVGSNPDQIGVEVATRYPKPEPFHWASAARGPGNNIFSAAPARSVSSSNKRWNHLGVECEYGDMDVHLDPGGNVVRDTALPPGVTLRPVSMPRADVFVPYWMPAVVFSMLLMVSAMARFGWRYRPPAHCCTRCGYDLTGNTSGVCPECGTAKQVR